jgi:hypothetical protein
VARRTVKHLSLHRIAGAGHEPHKGTELRVVADVETGVLPVIEAEEAVIRAYVRQGTWPHRWVTLFILQDLQPLVRQLTPTPSLPLVRGGSEGGGPDLPPGGATDASQRPVVNVYDLADPTGCHVFVNRRAMAEEGYWDDVLAMQGLLAHEHAHPLAENATARASRRLQLDLSLTHVWQDEAKGWTTDRQDKIHGMLRVLAANLCTYGPREVYANEMAIRSGFGEALLYLDRRNVANARRSLAGRRELHWQLRQEVAQGTFNASVADLLLLVGDLKSCLALSIETAAFYRAGRERDARELEAVLEADVFPHLEPETGQAYAALREWYMALLPDLTLPELTAWGEKVLDVLAQALAGKGLTLRYLLGRMDQRGT